MRKPCFSLRALTKESLELLGSMSPKFNHITAQTVPLFHSTLFAVSNLCTGYAVNSSSDLRSHTERNFILFEFYRIRFIEPPFRPHLT